MYLFSYDPLTQIAFICDGATTNLAFSDRYVQGVLDPFDQFGVTLNFAAAQGTSLLAQGLSAYALGVSNYALGLVNQTLVGTTASSFGTDLVDPTTVFGFLKRAQETREGNETYTKASGDLDIYSRGSSQLIASKTVSDTTAQTTKT